MIPLSGGEKDITAPKVINQSPANAELNFRGDKLIIDFDEYVQLKDIQGQLIVTPQINYLPEANVKGKRLELNFKEPLRKETTYSINFGSSISDIHEGNILQDYNVVFSTGNFIDTLSIQGRITDAFTKKSRNDVSVFLYENGNDSSCFIKKPDYFVKSDNSGNFKINNVRPGKYKFFAFNDKNRNLIFDQAEESIDEWPDTPNSAVELMQNEFHDFSVFKDYGNKLFIKKQYFDGVGKIKYCFNRPLKIPELKSAYSNEILKYFSKTKDTLTVYFTNDLPDTLMISLYENKVLADTLYLIKPVINPNSSKGILKPRILFVGEAINDSALYLFFNTALKKNRLLKNLIKVRGSEKNEILKFDSISPESCKLIFKNRISDGEIVLAPDIIESWYGQKNDSVKIKFAFPSITSKGELKINLSTKFSSNHILQLMNESNQLVYEHTLVAKKDKVSKLFISGITPGNYKLRVVVDANGDDVWTSGDLLMKIKPEKVYYYDKPIEIISEWETNIEFNLEK